MSDPFITESDVKDCFGNSVITNAMIKSFDIDVIGHFGNVVTLDMLVCWNEIIYCNPLGGYNLTGSIGNVIRLMFGLLDICEEDGQRLSKLKDIPCRIVLNHAYGEVIGIGHFMQDRFVLTDDLIAFLNKKEGEKK